MNRAVIFDLREMSLHGLGNWPATQVEALQQLIADVGMESRFAVVVYDDNPATVLGGA